jgi:glycosyltransferase involved in cell wall biosynthesis
MTLLKVCIFTETYYPEVGGGETQSRLLAESLIAGSHSVVILTRRSRGSSARSERVGVTPVFRLPPSGSGQLKKWGLIFSSIPWLVRMRRHYDLVFVSGYRVIGISALLMCKLLGKRCILKADSQGEMSGRFFWPGLKRLGFSPAWWPFAVLLWLRNGVLRKADAFSAISDDIAVELSAAGVASSKINMIPNSVDTTRFCPADPVQKTHLRDALALSREAAVAVYTGRLVSYKGLLLLLKVWRRIRTRYASAILVLVGSGGLDIHNCEAELRAYVDAHGLGEVIRFAGSVPNVHEYLLAADLFVFPTENDAFPSSLIEAMACGLPVVTTHVGAISSIVTDGRNGLVVVPGDEQQLYQALDTLLSDSVLAARLGQAARKTVQEQYSASRVTAAYLALFRSVAHYAPDASVTSTPIDERLL